MAAGYEFRVGIEIWESFLYRWRLNLRESGRLSGEMRSR